jgi:uncharacterized protein YceH (UPF0502 family)
VPRYRHLFQESFGLNRAESAALCILMLRGPQTVGEIRGHSNRLYDFASLAEVQETLDALLAREKRPLVARLSRQTGTKEPRVAHLLSGDVADLQVPSPASEPEGSSPTRAEARELVERLESEIQKLRGEVEELKHMFELFRRQFE